jgi:hypothetical protein
MAAMRRWKVGASIAAVMALVAPEARAADEPEIPWDAGAIAPSAAFGFEYNRDSLSLSFGAGFDYYVLRGFSFGLYVGDQIQLYSNDLRARLVGVEDQIPTNLFNVTGLTRFVFYRGRRFSPFLFAGLGPTIFNNGNGTFGHWVAGPGAYVHLVGDAYLDIGMNFTGMFPVERCGNSFEFEPARGSSFRAVDDFCSFRWGPRLGIVVQFGARPRSEPIPPPPKGETTSGSEPR